MAKPYPYLQRETTRHGKTAWYVRIGDGPRIRLKEEYGSPEFTEAHRAAVSSLMGGAANPRRKPQTGSLAWLAERYRETDSWSALSPATRRQRDNIFTHLLAESGAVPYGHITRRDIQATIDKRRDRAAAGRHFLETVRGMFEWAVEAELLTDDPTAGIKFRRRKSDGYEPWSDDDCESFERRWPLGTRQRLAYVVLLETGLRRGDAVNFGRQHVRGNVATVRTEKTGEPVIFTISPALAEALAAGPCGELTFIAGERRQRMTKESFGNWFRAACTAAGIEKSAHGLRKTGAIRHALDGATENELMARYGWAEPRTAAIYTRKANRERLALAADAKRQSAQSANTVSPYPKGGTPHLSKKSEKSAS